MRKRQASDFLKKAVSVLVALVRTKSMSAKHRATAAVKARLPMLLGLVREKKLQLNAISQKIHALVVTNHDDNEDAENTSKAIVLYSGGSGSDAKPALHDAGEAADWVPEEDDYPDLRHSMFDEEDCYYDDDADDQECLQAIGSEEKLEEEIDNVADAYIRRFRRQIMMQKLESFKRYKEMMERSL